MCGIAGTFAYADSALPVDRRELVAVRDQMASRGPDGKDEWFSGDGRVGLVHRRLAIIDLSEMGRQPMQTPDGRLVIVFNGEIYNYRELREALEAKGYSFRSQSDTEVLLMLYQDLGERMVHVLRGMFAFAIWDQEKGGVFLARDPFGIKPLYVSDQQGTLRFASQVKALMAGGGVSRKEEPAGYVGFLLWGFVPEPFTLYKSIRSLPAGSTLWLDRGGGRHANTYFSPNAEIVGAEAARGPSYQRELSRDALHDVLEQSVAHHLVADVPVGLFLSAGIDSCVIANLAGERLGSHLHSLTLGFTEFKHTASDETVLAARVAADLGVEHSTRWTTRSDAQLGLPEFFDDMDQPSMDGLNTWLVSKAARDTGIKVALSGLGGDEMFAGYPSFRQVPMTARWMGPFSSWPQVASTVRRLAEPLISSFTSSKYAGIFEYGGSLPGAYLLRRALYMPWELERVLEPSFVEEGLEALQTASQLHACIEGIHNERLAVSSLELQWYLRSQLLRDSDWAGMAHSVEIRVPFVDVAVFRAVVRMVLEGNAPTKKDVVACIPGSLPMILGSRPKTGFNVPLRDWFVRDTPGSNKKERGLRTWARTVLERWEVPDEARSWTHAPAVVPRTRGADH